MPIGWRESSLGTKKQDFIPAFCDGPYSVLLAALAQDLQSGLGQFTADCEVAWMRISTFKSKAMDLNQKKVACSLQVGGDILPQVEDFKYHVVLFTSEERMEGELDRRISASVR